MYAVYLSCILIASPIDYISSTYSCLTNSLSSLFFILSLSLPLPTSATSTAAST